MQRCASTAKSRVHNDAIAARKRSATHNALLNLKRGNAVITVLRVRIAVSPRFAWFVFRFSYGSRRGLRS
jgi:hypothetical protein